MARTATKEVFAFDELDESAKESAREWYRRDALDYEWWDCTIDDFCQILARLGYSVDAKEVYFSGFCSQGDGASFTGSYGYVKGAAKAVKGYAPKDTELHALADRLQAMQRRNFYKVTGSIGRRSRYCHEMTMQCDVDRADGAEWSQEGYNAAQEEFEDVSRDLARWLYRTLEKEHEWLLADEQVDETILANGYEFDEYGAVA